MRAQRGASIISLWMRIINALYRYALYSGMKLNMMENGLLSSSISNSLALFSTFFLGSLMINYNLIICIIAMFQLNL